MKNIIVSIDEETFRLASVKAAECGTSVSALVRDYLVGLAQNQMTESEFNQLHRPQNETLPATHARGGGLRAADNLPRGDLHRRDSSR